MATVETRLDDGSLAKMTGKKLERQVNRRRKKNLGAGHDRAKCLIEKCLLTIVKSLVFFKKLNTYPMR